MNNAFELPAYDLLAESLGQGEPAELHGLLCGQLCARPRLPPQVWLDTALVETDADAAVAEILQQLYDTTARQLDDPQFQLQLLLPDDAESLEVRLEALAGWGHGFLTGLGLGGLKNFKTLSGEAGEFLRDLDDIIRVDFDASAGEEADETAYAEIIEYLRVGVLLVHQTLRSHAAERLH